MSESLLERINQPSDLRGLPLSALPNVAQEIRQLIIDKVSKTGGHFSGPLGAVDLVVALHYVFNTPEDKLVWDVGYQAYAHKILTGRRERFGSLRQWGGISGFPHREESPHDLFTIGHGGTSISTGLGLARARDHQGERYQVVAVIGDGSLPEGMALEGLNHAGHVKTNFLVILNDNSMAIAPAIGALTHCFNRIITDPLYNRVRREVERVMCRVPRFGYRILRAAKRLEESLKSLLVPGIIFEELGLRYFGPIDGHNLEVLVKTLRHVKDLPGPKLLHVRTTKGRGYPLAEKEQWKYHGVTPFDPATGEFVKKPAAETFTQRFGKAMIRLAREKEPLLIAITAAMPDGTGLVEYSRQIPERFYDVAMCEQHAVAFAAGLARGGLKPVAAIYSTFLQRGYDQVIHDVCIQNLPVIFSMDRAGLVGDDGITHHGVFDVAYLSALPRLVFMAPKDPDELEAMLEFACDHSGPIALRYPRGGVLRFHPDVELEIPPPDPIRLGRAEVLRRGSDLAIVALGSMVYPAMEAARLLEEKGISATVVNARFVKPLDMELYVSLVTEHQAILTVEEAAQIGGFGSRLMAELERMRNGMKMRIMGIPDRFFEHGKREILLKEARLTPDAIELAARELLERGTVYVH